MATKNGTISDDILEGTDEFDILNGLAGNDTLYGGNGNDTLNGGEGDDILDGGIGADLMDGGNGNDTYIVDNVSDLTEETALNDSNSFDTVESSITWVLGDNLEKLVLTGNAAINGTGNDLGNLIYGNSGNNSLFGGFGDDLLDGGAGADRMEGGSGSDTYIVDNIGDQIIESNNPSYDTDTIESSISWALGTNIERLVLTGNAAINGTGNGLNNGLTGNDANNSLFGGAGDDGLVGGGGSDILDGGDGNDNYYISDNTDTIIEGVNGGIDSVYSSVTWTLGTNVEALYLIGEAAINGTGNALNNSVQGNDASNTLNGGDGDDDLTGGGGNDILNGGNGNDLYLIYNDDIYSDANDTIVEDANGGIDLVLSAASWTLSANVENLTLYALSSLDTMYGTGNELSNEIKGDFSLDTLRGKAGNDILMSGGGNDTLIGGKGSDTLTGGAGADRFLRKYSTTAIDTITDFQTGEDLLGFSASGFGGGLAGGAVLNETQFTIGSAAADSSDRFIYNSATGGLFFDADGVGGAAQVKIFTLSSGLAMTNADIFIFA